MLEKIKKIIVSEDSKLKDAIEVLNNGGRQVLLITDKQQCLRGILTDGDIRRYLLHNKSLDISLNNIMNKDFVSLGVGERSKAEKILKNSNCNHVPILNNEKKVVDLVTIQDFIKHRVEGKDNSVVIMAGGKGTRLEPITKIIPKPLIPVGDKTVIEIVMDKFAAFGFGNFVVTLNYKKELFKAYFSEKEVNNNLKISYFEEMKYLGTVGALPSLKERLTDTFFLSNCDIFADLDYNAMLNWHEEHNADMTLLGVRENIDVPYGVIEINKNSYVTSFREKPNYNFIVNAGIYIIESELIDLIPEDKYYGMNELIDECIKQKKRITCYPIEDRWYGTGQFFEYEKTINKLKDVNI